MDASALKNAGWESVEMGGFTGLAGPFWRRRCEAGYEVGLLIEEKHCNSHLGTIHGGVVMTFADIGLGTGIANVLGEQRFNAVTASLQTQFIAVARIGDFITCDAEVVHRGKSMLFVRGLIKTGDKVIASVEGIWKVLGA